MSHTQKIERPTGSISPIKMCQPGHIIYPVRLALSKTYLDNIPTSSALPVLPKSFAELGGDYETRQLRTGYIYILMLNINPSSREEFASTRANNMYNWLIYQYTTKDISDGYSATMYHFLRYPYGNLTAHWHIPADNIGKPFIPLPPGVSVIDIMYSETALAPEILEKLANDESTRNDWMQKFFLNKEEGLVKKIDTKDQIKDYVADFNDQQQFVAQEEDNARRNIFIGKRPEYEKIITQINNCNNVHLVALKDPVGTVRDLSGYHHYLAKQRQTVMRKYEYAITTAQIIHNYVTQKYIKARNDYNAVLASGSAGFGVIPAEEINDIYASLNIHKAHLTQHGNNDIFDALKAEFAFETDIKGINSVHKMATIPTLYGKPFKNLVRIFTHYLNSSEIKNRFETLTTVLLTKNTSSKESTPQYITENWCLFMQSILHGLDASSYGRNAIIAALCPRGKDFSFPNTAQTDDGAISALKNILGNTETILNTLKENAIAEEFNLSAYDSFIRTVIDKMAVHDTYRKKGEPTYQELVQVIYGKQSPLAPNSPPNSSSYDELFKTMPFEGLKKTLFFSQLLATFWDNNNAKTEAGKLAQDPTLLAANMLLNEYATKGSILERVRNGEKFPKFSSNAARLKYVVMNMNTLLAGISALFAYGNWKEASYKGDEAAMYGALLQGVGGITFEGSIGALGYLSLQTPTPVILRLITLARVGTAIGALLLLAGLIASAFERVDMEIWIENGFWGKSEFYWGNAVNAYQWENQKRVDADDFLSQIDMSIFTYENDTNLKSSEIVKCYQIEMQRYYQFSIPIKLSLVSKEDKHKILVEHPSITSQEIAQQIRAVRGRGDAAPIIIIAHGEFYSYAQPNEIIFDENKLGQAILCFPTPWTVTPVTQAQLGTFERYEFERNKISKVVDENVYGIKIRVAIPHYQGATTCFMSKEQATLYFR
ncbi:hypothetical protein O1Q80_01034 [Lonepinella sp. MS14435]